MSTLNLHNTVKIVVKKSIQLTDVQYRRSIVIVDKKGDTFSIDLHYNGREGKGFYVNIES